MRPPSAPRAERTARRAGHQALGAAEHPTPRVASTDAAERRGVSRRGFLQAATLFGAAGLLAACERRPVTTAIPYLVPPEEITPGVSVRYASTCQACPAACGLLVTCRDGRPIKLEGRPEHPRSRGGLCPVGQADVRALYDGGRLAAPHMRGTPVSWDALDAHVRTALAPLVGEQAGTRVVVLSHTIVSPTTRAAIAAFLAPYDGAHVEYDLPSASAALEVAEALSGRAVLPGLALGATDVLVTLGADLFGAGADSVAVTRARAERRSDRTRPAFRHVHFEGSWSLTGAAADERLPVTAAGRRIVALALLARIAAQTAGGEGSALAARLAGLPAPPIARAKLDALASELLAAGAHGALVSGANDVLEQTAVALANRLLQSQGVTVTEATASLLRRGRDASLATFRKQLTAGAIGAVIVLDADPVDELPDGAALGAALSKLGLSVAITDRPTATAAACTAVAAAHHRLERWGDAQPQPGVLTLAQPAVRPLLDTRHPWESLAAWSASAGAADADAITPASAYRQLMAAWQARVFPSVASGGRGFGAFFSACVKQGAAPAGATYRGAALPERRAPKPALTFLEAALRAVGDLKASSDALEVEILDEVGRRDGALGFVPWLRELPDPLTRVAWEPCVRIAPARAAALGIEDGALLAISAGKPSVTLPARVTPGQHPQVLGVPTGYGRTDGEAEREPAARDARRGERLEASDPGGHRRRTGLPATVSAAGGALALPLTQWHSRTEDRPILYQVPDRETPVDKPEDEADLWPERDMQSPHWHLSIDLDRCTGCSACVVACQAENNLAVVGADEVRRHRDMAWLRLDRYYVGEGEATELLFTPMLCQQCDHAPCETVCPVAATMHSADGLNQQVYNRCVGTRYCANNCPYKARRFNWFDYWKNADFSPPTPRERMVLNPDVVVRSRGIMEKCTFCVQRIQAERIAARRERRPLEPDRIQTACQQSCPAAAIHFGDAADPDARILTERAEPRSFQVLAELGVKPSVTYLARVRTPSAPGSARPSEAREGAGS